MTEPRLPRLDRLLLAVLRGPGAEFVVGDIVERYATDAAERGLVVARRRLRRQAVAAHWHRWTRRASGQDEGRVKRHLERGGDGMGGWVQDVRLALRGWRRKPAFAAAVVLTLGIGIGATTTIYSVVDGVLFRPLPYDDPHDLVAVGTTFPGREWADRESDLMHLAGTSLLNFRDFQARSRTLAELGGVEVTSVLLPDDGDGPELVNAAAATEGFFAMLRVSPAMGRLFLPEEHVYGSESPVLLSHSTWVTRYGADPAVLGRQLGRTGSPATIVGVLPADFVPPEVMFGASNRPEYWLPLQPEHPRYAARGMRSLALVGRLAEASTVDDARVELQAIATRLAVEFPDGNVYPDGSHFGAGANGLHHDTVGTTGRALTLFLAASLLLLLIAALNSATLLLARALDRVRELGVRAALGAGRGRIVRMLLTESVLLSGVGGLLGIGIAYAGVSLFLDYAPASIPRTGAVAVDGRVLVATLTISIGAGLLAGLLPALRHSLISPSAGLHSGVRTSDGADSRLRFVLVAGQLALAVVLLAGAGLLGNSLHRLRTVDPGFEPAGLASYRLGTKRPGAPEGEQMWQAWDLILEEADRIPGVTSVAATSNPPFQSPWWAPRVLLPGDPEDAWREGIAGYAVTPGYFETVGTQMLQGRDFEPQDGPDGPWVAVVNETFVEEQLGGAPPLGTYFNLPSTGQDFEIVGVVEDVIQGRAEEGSRAAIYFSYTQSDMPFAQVMVRSTLPTETLFPEIRQAALRFSRVIPALDLSTMEARMAGTRTTPRFQALLIGAFALVALVLAAAGLYGSLAHAVGRRRRELGIRIAMGAERRVVLRMVLMQGARIALVGLGLGLAVALGTSRLLASFLYGVEPGDVTTLLSVSVLLAAVTAIACLRPAMQATSVDPIEVLKIE